MVVKEDSMTKDKAEGILKLQGPYDQAQLKAVYRSLVKKNHPDQAKANGLTAEVAEARMVNINAAYQYLMNLFRTTKAQTITSTYEPVSSEQSAPPQQPQPAQQANTVSNATYAPPQQQVQSQPEPQRQAQPGSQPQSNTAATAEPEIDWEDFWRDWDKAYKARVAQKQAEKEVKESAAVTEESTSSAENTGQDMKIKTTAIHTPWYKLLRRILTAEVPWRIILVALIMLFHSYISGGTANLASFNTNSLAADMPWLVLIDAALVIVVVLNLLTGILTKKLCDLIGKTLDKALGQLSNRKKR